MNLLKQHLTNPRIHVIPASKNLHIGGSVMKAMYLISQHYPTVRYMYYLQHDFFFFKDIDHTALINVMDRYPDTINYVRFPKRAPWRIHRGCKNATDITYNTTVRHVDVSGSGEVSGDVDLESGDGVNSEKAPPQPPSDPSTLTLYPTNAYSDNNHLVRFDWYKETIFSLQKLNRAPEDPLQKRAFNGCFQGSNRGDNIVGLFLYPDMCIGHLDGRHTASAPG